MKRTTLGARNRSVSDLKLPKTPFTATKALVQFLVINVALLILFFLIRIPLMDDYHYIQKGEGQRVINALYVSTMMQTTVGASGSVVTPNTTAARTIDTIQSLSTFLAAGIIVLIVLLKSKV